jgi:hypothetical protein
MNEGTTATMNGDEPLSILRHLWLMFVIITFVNAAIWWSRGHPEIANNPALKWGYVRLIRGYLIFGNIPWLILGAAFELPSAFRGPLLIAFAVTIVVYWIAAFYWLAFAGGAEELAAHPGILRGAVRDPRTVKAQVLGIMVATVVGMLLVIGFFVFAPPPPGRH